jgi:hypothetical protein
MNRLPPILVRAAAVGFGATPNYANGLRFIQDAQTFLSRGDTTNALNNIRSAYGAAGVQLAPYATPVQPPLSMFPGETPAQVQSEQQQNTAAYQKQIAAYLKQVAQGYITDYLNAYKQSAASPSRATNVASTAKVQTTATGRRSGLIPGA